MKILGLLQKVADIVWVVVFYAAVTLAVVLSAVRIATPYMAAYLPELEQRLSKQFQLEVNIESLDAGWQGFGPAMRFENVELFTLDTHEPVARLNNLDIQLNIFQTIRERKLIPGRLTLDGMDLDLIQGEDGQYHIRHLAGTTQADPDWWVDIIKRFHRVDIKDSEFEVYLQSGTPIVLQLNYLSLSPDGNRYRFELDIQRQDMPGRLGVIADLTGALNKPEKLIVDGYANLKHIALDSRLMQKEWAGIKASQGSLDLSAWFQWREGRWQRVIGEIALKDVMLQNVEKPELKMPLALTADIAWEQQGGDFWRLSGDDIELKVGQQGSPVAAFLLEGGPFTPWQFKLDAIALDDITDLLTLSDRLTPDRRDWLTELKPQALLKNIQFRATLSEGEFIDWEGGLFIQGWGNQPVGKLPGFKNVSGEFKFSKAMGQFTFDTHESSIDLNNLFTQPLAIDHFEGAITFKRDNGYEIRAPHLKTVFDDVTLETSLAIDIPKEAGETQLSLVSQASDFDAEVALKYLPVGALSPNLTQWLYSSIQRGYVEHFQMVVDGPVVHFPFKEGKGDYELKLVLRDLDLAYKEDWPMIQDVSGEVVIDSGHVQAFIDEGYLYQSLIEQAKAEIKLGREEDPLRLKISGLVNGPAKDAEDFLRNSPLWEKLEGPLSYVNIEGPLRVDLNLDIPLKPDEVPTKVLGHATLTDGDVALEKFNLAFDHVNGTMDFTEQYLSAKNIRAKLFDYDAQLNVTPFKMKEGYRMDWHMTSKVTPQLLKAQVAKIDLWDLMQGETDFMAKFSTYAFPQSRPFEIIFSSDLEGIAVEAPSPLGKLPKEKVDLRFAVISQTPTAWLGRLEYGDALGGLMAFEKEKGEQRLRKAHFALGGEVPEHLGDVDGLRLTGDIKTLKLDDWIAFSQLQGYFEPNRPSTLPPIDNVSIDVGEFHYRNFLLHSAHIDAAPLKDAWRIGLNSTEIQGDIVLPTRPKTAPIVFNLDRCFWPTSKSKSDKPMDPKDVVAMDFTCREFTLDNHDLGEVHVVSIPQENGVMFDPIHIKSNIDEVNAKLSWFKQGKHIITSLTGDAQSKNVMESLRGWGMTTDIRGAQGQTDYEFTWPGSPMQFNKAKVRGNMDVYLKNGRFVDVNPGFGRVLGLLSLQSIQRRLRLDFSDVFQEGFSFDTFASSVAILNGELYTEDATMKAPAANINFTGRAGLVKRDLNFDMYVHANMDSTVTAAAAAVSVANPAVGAAVWIADKIFNPFDNVGRYHYHVTGTWDEPVFTDLTKEYKEALKKPVPTEEAIAH